MTTKKTGFGLTHLDEEALVESVTEASSHEYRSGKHAGRAEAAPRKAPGKKQVNLLMSIEIDKRLARYAFEHDTNKASVVEGLLTAFLTRKGF